MAASRRRVDQPARFPDADDLLTAMHGFLDVTVVGVAAQISRRWRRAAVTRALWQGFVQRRWPDVWSGLAAPRLSTRARCIAGWPVPSRGGRRRPRESWFSSSSR